MQWFFDRISTKFYPISFGYVFKKNQSKDFDILSGHKIITHTVNLDEVDCDLCNENHTTLIRQDGSKLFIVCEYDGGVRDIKSEELAIYEYQPQTLLSMFQTSLGIESPKVTKNISELLWSFGAQKINGTNYQLFFTNDVDQLDTSPLSIITALPQSVLFYTGTPHKSLPNKIRLVPLLDLIKVINKKGIQLYETLLEEYFPADLYPTKEGVLELDQTVALQGNALLSEPIRGGTFKKSIKIRPLAKRIIERLYQIRKYPKNSMTLGELASALNIKSLKKGSKVSVSNEIKRIENICNENDLKQILYKFNDEKWGINPLLDCCQ